MNKTKELLEKLKAVVADLESVVVAYSGGVDSSLLIKVCQDVLGDKAVAVTAVSETYPDFELKTAKKTVEEVGIKHLVVETGELENKEFAKNPPNRCFFCKTELFTKLRNIADALGFKNIVDGSNMDDEGDFRPGLKAAKQLGSVSPLRIAGFTKNDVREVSKLLGLSTWDKPAFACMSSRIPYGQEITVEKLSSVMKAEEFLRNAGFNNFRVRHHGTVARIELPANEIGRILDEKLRGKVVEKFKEFGFVYITVDIEGLRSGSMNEVLKETDKEVQPAKTAQKQPVNGKKRLTVFTDGGSRGNPGIAGIGVAIYENGPDSELTLLKEVYDYIGEATNNVAEYTAIKRALEALEEFEPQEVLFKLDSELIVKQINKVYKVKSPNMIPLYNEVSKMLRKLPKYRVAHVPRSQNSVADALANKGMDSA